MKRLGCVLVAVMVLGILWSTSEARVKPELEEGRATFNLSAGTQDYEYVNDLHIGALWFPSIAKKGHIGYYDISAFYPGGGDQSDLWNAGMWAGGYVEGRANPWQFYGSDGHASEPYDYDTLNEPPVLETESDLGLTFPYRRLTVHVNTAAKPYTISLDDTLDGDMGLDVTFEWHQCGVGGYDHWVLSMCSSNSPQPSRTSTGPG